ncbi:class I SAM-dependent methyltransferase [Candidatus Nitrosacidococcus sp. I8]|uniref:class I SAM-dependent methyltransferase n=1 Tax=Candidatus Nitrosacidococcus sp. I8 TaxID=2942908 RepID=UPI00222749C6|nr:class I SAM-dependent methyltransferase [Candidatus Nitrosacidococcus sp. I8]CAH9017912.1 2-methoxy-6-polyprenyl-1,4-benzoquinol methylase, mitochondrial [Candidatus Nitrosacidococcus sp. I8]
MEKSDLIPKTKGSVLKWQAHIYDFECTLVGLSSSFRQVTLNYVQLNAGMKVLDIGCGTGVLTRLAAEKIGDTGEIIGIDPSPQMISLAQKKSLQLQSTAKFKLEVIENLPFPDRSFDLVLSSLMFHHLPTDLKLKGLQEIYRVLRPDGRFLGADIGKPKYSLWWLVLWPYLIIPNIATNIKGEIPNYLNQAGFEKTETLGYWFSLINFWSAKKPAFAPKN